MVLKIFGALLFFCVAILACTKKITPADTGNKIIEVAKSPVTANKSAEATAAAAYSNTPKEIEDNVVAMLKRTPCFGKCPSYEVKIYDNGTAVYQGFAYVDRLGIYETKVSPNFLSRLQLQAQKNTFMSLNAAYPSNGQSISDLPSTISFVRTDKKGLRVVNNYDAPQELLAFETWLENEINQLDWKKQ